MREAPAGALPGETWEGAAGAFVRPWTACVHLPVSADPVMVEERLPGADDRRQRMYVVKSPLSDADPKTVPEAAWGALVENA